MMNKRPDQIIWMGDIPHTPLGAIWTAVSPNGLVAVSLWGERARFEAEVKRLTGHTPVYAPEAVTAVLDQITAYLHKERREFDLPIDWSALMPFQTMALRAVCEIAYGRTRTYRDIAAQIGRPTAARAVGRANATNPMPLVIPCHRVLGADGKLHGYGAPGGLETKAWLLRLEGSWLL
jgi:methylated-DNA-[protein]-cysteine S-methyltransferase